jgi:4-hydroxybenzoate polyprenyltransferase
MFVIVLLFGVYALMKRVMYYPQVVLGIPFAWAVFFCVVALGKEPFPFSISTVLFHGSTVEDRQGARADAMAQGKATLALLGANIMWTVTYDTIYAHQDVADDAQAGVKSMALWFRHSTKALASILTMAQVGLLALCGMYAGFSTLYFIGTVGGVAVAMAYYIYDVNLDSPESCGARFHDQFWIVGATFMQGQVCEYARKLGNGAPST